LGSVGYYYKQIEAMKLDIAKLSHQLTSAIRKLHEIEKGDQNKNEVLHSLGDQMKRVNTQIEEMPSVNIIDNIITDINELASALGTNDIAVNIINDLSSNSRSRNYSRNYDRDTRRDDNSRGGDRRDDNVRGDRRDDNVRGGDRRDDDRNNSRDFRDSRRDDDRSIRRDDERSNSRDFRRDDERNSRDTRDRRDNKRDNRKDKKYDRVIADTNDDDEKSLIDMIRGEKNGGVDRNGERGDIQVQH
jgi:hypothetical protein